MGVSRVRALISVPLPQVWEFLIKPENMHLWEPLTRPVADFDRPFQAGDHLTLYRRDFFRNLGQVLIGKIVNGADTGNTLRNHSQVMLVEKVVPYHSLHLRDLSPGAARANVTVTLSVEEARDQEATWVEEAIFYSFGSGRVLQWLDRWLINPIIQLVASYKTKKAFRRLESILRSSQVEHKGTRGRYPEQTRMES